MKYLPIYLLVTFLLFSFLLGFTPLLLSIIFLLVSLITYFIYFKDKNASIKGRWRVPENTLHLWSLMGGWPGAMLAQQHFRHKTQKLAFRIPFWISLSLNVVAIALLHFPSGMAALGEVTESLEQLLIKNYSSSQTADVLLFVIRRQNFFGGD